MSAVAWPIKRIASVCVSCVEPFSGNLILLQPSWFASSNDKSHLSTVRGQMLEAYQGLDYFQVNVMIPTGKYRADCLVRIRLSHRSDRWPWRVQVRKRLLRRRRLGHDAEFFHFWIECCPFHAQASGGSRGTANDPLWFAEGAYDVFAFRVMQGSSRGSII